jgi:hypothetical protein
MITGIIRTMEILIDLFFVINKNLCGGLSGRQGGI